MTSTLQTRLVIARRQVNMSQQQLADAIGITQGAYSELERTEGAGSKHLYEIARILNVHIDWLRYGDEDAPDYEEQLPQFVVELQVQQIYKIPVAAKTKHEAGQLAKQKFDETGSPSNTFSCVTVPRHCIRIQEKTDD